MLTDSVYFLHMPNDAELSKLDEGLESRAYHRIAIAMI